MSRRANRVKEILVVTAGAIALVVFWHTACPSITWWDSSSYSTGAYTLGITIALVIVAALRLEPMIRTAKARSPLLIVLDAAAARQRVRRSA